MCRILCKIGTATLKKNGSIFEQLTYFESVGLKILNKLVSDCVVLIQPEKKKKDLYLVFFNQPLFVMNWVKLIINYQNIQLKTIQKCHFQINKGTKVI